jgi:hypothetical protein
MKEEDTAHVDQSAHHDFSVAVSLGNDLVVSVNIGFRGVSHTPLSYSSVIVRSWVRRMTYQETTELTDCSTVTQSSLPGRRDLESPIRLFHTESIPERRICIKVVDQDDIETCHQLNVNNSMEDIPSMTTARLMAILQADALGYSFKAANRPILTSESFPA